MSSDGAAITAFAFAAAALAYGLLAARMLVGSAAGDRPGAGSGATTAFLTATGLTTLWGAVGAFAGSPPGAWAALALGLLDVLRYGAWFWFLLIALRPSTDTDASGTPRPPWLAPTALGITAVAAMAHVFAALDEGTLALRVHLFSAMVAPVMGLVLVEQLLRGTAPSHRWGVKPLCIGLGGLFVFDLYLYSNAVLFGQFDETAFAARPAIHMLAVPLLYIATRRQAGWRTRLQASHTAAFTSLTLLLAGVYLLVVSGIGYYLRYFGGTWGGALQVTLLFGGLTALAALMVSGTLRSRLRLFIGKHFFAYRFDYRDQWLRFTHTLAGASTPRDLGRRVAQGLADMVDSTGASLWLLGTDGDFIENTVVSGTAERHEAPAAFVSFLIEQGWIVDVAEARAHPERYAGMVLPGWITERPEVWAVVPLIIGERLSGIVLLSRPRAGAELDWEVRDLLKTASRQAAAFLAQMNAADALMEARKFEAFNRMSAFVVHDLKNIVTQLSLMMKNARRLRDNPEFQEDMLATVESSLEKMRQLMLQLREGNKPTGTAAGVELLPIVQRIADAAALRGRTLELARTERVATRGHEERIERVLGHLVQNAFDATPADGRVWVELSRYSGQARVVVGDTGQGMTREFVEQRLFKPFSTTKDGGMGIGTYESSQYLRELGGRIDVDSEPGRGTVITVVLPLFDRNTDDAELPDDRAVTTR